MRAILLLMTDIDKIMADKNLLKREIRYYARRSIKEMDALFARFLAEALEDLDSATLVQLRDLLLGPDEPIRAMLDGEMAFASKFQEILTALHTAREGWRRG